MATFANGSVVWTLLSILFNSSMLTNFRFMVLKKMGLELGADYNA